eukprot:31138-Pelagococcus_subviridis.AAC.10
MLSFTANRRDNASRSFDAAVYTRASRSKSSAFTSAGSGSDRRAKRSHASYIACGRRRRARGRA